MLWSSPTDRRSKLLKETNLGVLPPRVSPGQRWASSSRNLPSAVVAWDLWGGNGRGRVGPGAGTSPPRPRRTVLKAPARPPSRVPEAQTGKPPEDSGGGGRVTKEESGHACFLPGPRRLHLRPSPHVPPFLHKLVSKASALGRTQPAPPGEPPSRGREQTSRLVQRSRSEEHAEAVPLSRALSAGRVGCWDKAQGVASGARTGQGGGSGGVGWEGLGGTPPGEGAGQRSAQVCELSSIRRQHLHP